MKRISECLYRWMKRKRLIRTEHIRNRLSVLHRGTAKQLNEAVDGYYIHNLSLVLTVLMLVIAGSIGIWLYECFAAKQGIHIVRNDYGEEETTYSVYYQTEDKTYQELPLLIEPVRYPEEILKQKFEDGFAFLEQAMLGDNPAPDQIQTDLNLPTSIPDSGLRVSWGSSDYELLEENGTVHNDTLTGAVSLSLSLTLSYEDREEIREYGLTICPKHLTPEEQRRRQLQLALDTMLQESAYEKDIYLPSDTQGIRLREHMNQGSKAVLFAIFGIGICGLLWFRKREELDRQLKIRKAEWLREYPYLVNQLLLYLCAGTTVKGALERIRKQYEQKSDTDNSLYQELSVMWNEMNAGVTQEQAYVNFGKRIGLLPYMKLASMLAQQIRKGSSGFVVQLEQEEHAAFEQRKERAKKAGEEAGTKLLFPMIVLMIISMLVVAGPALLNVAIHNG